MLSGSTPFRFRSKITIALAGIAGIAALVIAGCSSATPTGAGADSPASGLKDDRNSGPGAPAFAAAEDSGGAPRAPLYRGSPLCNFMPDHTCMPDDDRSCGGGGGGDAGEAGTATTVETIGCRIHRDSVDTFAPKCSAVNVDSAGGDAVACNTGADCVAGFDCVAGENGAKQCRHYCCAGHCKGQASQSGGATFCDVQDLVDVNQKAPVCMPLKHCELLGTGECNANESCAVVTETGDTGCVAVGDKQVGASCDADHCAAGLTCLGTTGSRECFKLCRVGSSDCGAAQVCATSTVFKDPNFGICQTP